VLSQLAERAVECWRRGDVNGALMAAGMLLEAAWREGIVARVATELAYAAVRREVVRGLRNGWRERARYYAESLNSVQYVVREVVLRVAEEWGATVPITHGAICCAGAGAKLATKRERGWLRARLPAEEVVRARAEELRVRFGLGVEEFFLRLGALLAHVLVEGGALADVWEVVERELERLAGLVGGTSREGAQGG